MNLTNETAYLYVYSKDLISLNKKLKGLSGKAEKHIYKHGKATSEEDRLKHRTKHGKVVGKIQKLMVKHNELLNKLRHHHVAYAHALRAEHKVK